MAIKRLNRVIGHLAKWFCFLRILELQTQWLRVIWNEQLITTMRKYLLAQLEDTET